MNTPQATRGPPLTPDFGSPVVPLSSLPWMMTAVPSASKIESGPSDSVTRVVTAFSVPLPSCADLEVGNVAHVERMIGVGIGVARRARIEVAAGGGEVRLALADRVQMNAVLPGLEAARRDGDVDDRAGALLALDELDRAGDAVALDVGVRSRRRACPARSRPRPAAPPPCPSAALVRFSY